MRQDQQEVQNMKQSFLTMVDGDYNEDTKILEESSSDGENEDPL